MSVCSSSDGIDSSFLHESRIRSTIWALVAIRRMGFVFTEELLDRVLDA
jgi:hypothetical protein